MDNIYSAYHYACKTKADREAIEELAPKVLEAADKAAFGNIGDIQYTARTTAPMGGEWCDGATYTKDRYPVLYDMLVSGKLQYVDIDTYNSVVELNGSCGFFGLDVANNSFRVPTLTNVYIKAGQVAEEFSAESLPNIKGEAIGAYSVDKNLEGTGAIRFDVNGNYSSNYEPKYENKGFSFDASRVSSTYQDGAKVNPDHVKYRAYVILYTGKDISFDKKEEYKLNNPFFFGMSQFFEVDPKNASWLLSNGAYHSGTVYKSFYEWLVREYNNPDSLPKKVNANIVGDLVVNDGVVSGFSSSKYLSNESFYNADTFEILLKFTTPSDITSNQKIFATSQKDKGIVLAILGGSLWVDGFADGVTLFNGQGYAVSVNTTYYCKVVYDGSGYDISYGSSLEEIALHHRFNVSTKIKNDGDMQIGYWPSFTAFQGSIDLNETYIKINNQIWWKGIDNAVRKPTEQYTDYDYVIDTANTTFRLPIKVKLASGSAVVGNGTTLGLTNGTSNFGLTNVSGQLVYCSVTSPSSYGASVGDAGTAIAQTPYGASYGVTTDATKSGIETSSNGLKLYFYVGETIQDAKVINASSVLNQIAKLESYDYVVDSYSDANGNWYRVYKSGWIEQGGCQSTSNWTTINLYKEMFNTAYAITAVSTDGVENKTTIAPKISTVAGSKTVRSFRVMQSYNSNTYYNGLIYWQVSGQGAK